MIDLDEIERLARAAQDAVAAFENAPRGEVPSMHLKEHSVARRAMDALHAELSAATVLALVARLRAAESALGLLIEELDDPCRRMPVCNWDAFSHAWVQDKTTHSVHLSLALEKQARAAYRALTEEPTP